MHRYVLADYLRLEAESSTRHEFLEGEIVALAGGTPEHAALAMAVGAQLMNQLGGGNCRVYSSDLRVHVVDSGLTTYPDVTVVCGPTERLRTSDTTVVNPKLLDLGQNRGTPRRPRRHRTARRRAGRRHALRSRCRTFGVKSE
jgi:Uma2 family endonuclease